MTHAITDSDLDSDFFDDDKFDAEEHDLVVVGTAPSKGKPSPRKPSPPPSPAQASATERSDWATAALSSLGFVACIGVVALGSRDSENTFRIYLPAIFMLVAYGLAFFMRFSARPVTSQIFFTAGSILFGVGLASLSAGRCPDFSTPATLGTFSEYAETIWCCWSLGVFLLALTLPFAALHFVTALGSVFWLVACDGGYDAIAVFAICALGEYWSRRHRNGTVATLYLGLGLFIVLTEPGLWTPVNLPLLGVIFAVIAYYAGATFKNVPLRGAALLIGGLALAVATFPGYWDSFFAHVNPDVAPVAEKALFHPNGAATIPALVCSCIFVFFCETLIMGGARRSRGRLIYGVVLTTAWVCFYVLTSRKEHGSGAASTALAILIVVFALALFAETALERLTRGRSRVLQDGVAASDGAEDDPDFDDPFDREARETQGADALAAEYVASLAIDYATRRFGKRLTIAALAVQFALLGSVSLAR